MHNLNRQRGKVSVLTLTQLDDDVSGPPPPPRHCNNFMVAALPPQFQLSCLQNGLICSTIQHFLWWKLPSLSCKYIP